MAITLAVGLSSLDCYRSWRQAGADRDLLKHETANPLLYAKLHADSRLDQRMEALQCLRGLGCQVGTGNIIGLPGQTIADLASDILLARELDVGMAAFGPLVPHPKSPLVSAQAPDIQLALRVIAAARLALGTVHIPATSAIDAIAAGGRERALRARANAIMANLTPWHCRRQYLRYLPQSAGVEQGGPREGIVRTPWPPAGLRSRTFAQTGPGGPALNGANPCPAEYRSRAAPSRRRKSARQTGC